MKETPSEVVLKALDRQRWKTCGAVVVRTGYGYNSIKAQLERLVRQGLVETREDISPVYRLSPKGVGSVRN